MLDYMYVSEHDVIRLELIVDEWSAVNFIFLHTAIAEREVATAEREVET